MNSNHTISNDKIIFLLVSLSMNLCENKTRGASHKTAKDKIVETRLTFLNHHFET